MNFHLLLHPKKSILGFTRFLEIFGIPGIYYSIYCLFSKRKKLARVSRKWTKHPLYIRLNTSDINVFRQVFIEKEYAIAQLITPKNIILDAGANIGLTAVFMAQHFPSSTIYSLEPESSNFELLCKNAAHYKNIKPIHGALWNQDEPLEIESNDSESWAFRVRSKKEKSSPTKIQGYRIGSLMKNFGIQKFDLIKMDIEGAEFEVLQDHANWIDRTDNIIIELHESIRPGCSDLFYKATSSFKYRTSGGELDLVSRLPFKNQNPSVPNAA